MGICAVRWGQGAKGAGYIECRGTHKRVQGAPYVGGSGRESGGLPRGSEITDPANHPAPTSPPPHTIE